MHRLLWALCILSVPATVARGQATVDRYIHFRDGSILRMAVADEDWDVTIIRANGGLGKERIKLSRFQSAKLTPEGGFSKKQALLASVQGLGADDFRDREKAYLELIKMGPAVAADLQLCLQLVTDVEARVRLQDVLARIAAKPSSPQPAAMAFDLFRLKESYWGHVGDSGLSVLVDGMPYRLIRRDVAEISLDPPLGLQGFRNGFADRGSGTIVAGLDEFPPNCIEESFERAANGRPLQIGENIEKLFINKGFVLSTSVPDSFVSINRYTVLGKSRGFSAATHQPMWEGEITVKFVQPGRADIPAGVNYFGCFIAAVVPRGTAMVAYDVRGREVGRVYTSVHGHQFLGLRSPIPIHRVCFIANPQLDRDYTLDDFIFSPPQAPEASHGTKYTAYLTGGSRVFCSDVSFQRGMARLYGMPAGLPDMIVPIDAVLRVNPPDHGKPAPPLPTGIFVELRDGSILFGAKRSAPMRPPAFSMLPDLLKNPVDLVGMWSSESSRLVPEKKIVLPAYWDPVAKQWHMIADVHFLDGKALWKKDMASRAVPYSQLGTLWLTRPRSEPAPGWHVHTRPGDDLVLDASSLEGRISTRLQATWHGRTLRLAATEIRSLFRVPK
jgi:hypothetical protein